MLFGNEKTVLKVSFLIKKIDECSVALLLKPDKYETTYFYTREN